MLKPHPESDLSSNVIILGGELIYLLKKNNGFVFVDNILNIFLSEDTKRTPEFFMDTLTFLYAMDLLDFHGHRIGLKK